MKKNIVSKLLTAVVAAAAAISIMGCSVTTSETKTVTVTENGKTTTTTTVKKNGKVVSQNKTEEEETTEAEIEHIVATIAFDNEAQFDIEEMYFALGTSDNWGEEILRDDAPLKDGEKITFHEALTYSEDSLYWELKAVDAEGASVEFGLDLSNVEDPNNITVLLEYDEKEDEFTATIM